MKILYCMACGTIVSPFPEPIKVRSCDCGQAQVRWIDPYAGKLEVKALQLDKVRVIGLNNVMLRAANFGPDEGQDPDGWWRQIHRGLTAEAPGYLFSTELRNCWAVIVAPGESGDIVWLTG